MLQIRNMALRDLPYIKDMEDKSFECPWEMSDFRDHVKGRNNHLLVAEDDCRIIGYMAYTVYKDRYEVLNLCVGYKNRREGVGTKLIDNLKNKLRRSDTKNCISMVVADYNLGAHLFLRSIGFLAQGVIKNSYDCPQDGVDGYLFDFTLHPVAVPT